MESWMRIVENLMYLNLCLDLLDLVAHRIVAVCYLFDQHLLYFEEMSVGIFVPILSFGHVCVESAVSQQLTQNGYTD